MIGHGTVVRHESQIKAFQICIVLKKKVISVALTCKVANCNFDGLYNSPTSKSFEKCFKMFLLSSLFTVHLSLVSFYVKLKVAP